MAALASLLAWGLATAGDAGPRLARNLQSLGEQARADRVPIVLLVSSTDCPYCEQLKREVITPMLRGGSQRGRMLLRELLIDAGQTVADFDGREQEGRTVAMRYKALFTPTVLFLDPEGRELATRLRGITTIEFYDHYFQRALAAATAALEQSSPGAAPRS